MKTSKFMPVLFSLILFLCVSFFSDNFLMLAVNAEETSNEELYTISKLLSLRYIKYDDYIEVCGIKINHSLASHFDNIDSLSIPDKIDGLPVTKLANLDFRSCKYLTNVSIPDTVKRMENCYFSAWYSNYIKNNTNPDGVIYLGKIAYAYKGNDKDIDKIVIKEGTLCMTNFLSGTNVTSVSFPSTLEIIPKGAFLSCINLKEITLPEGIKEIEDEAFYGCYKLEYLEMPDSIIKVGRAAFANGAPPNYDRLERIRLSDNLTEISDECFSNRSKYKEINLPHNLKVIGKHAFAGCGSLESICLPDSLERIESYAFNGNNIKSISTFTKKANEGELYFPDNLSYIGDYAFASSIATSYKALWNYAELPASLNEIYRNFVNYCTELKINNPNCIISCDEVRFCEKIHGYYGSTAEIFAKEKGFEFIPIEPIILKGDCNCDNAVNAKDLLMLQNFLFGNGILSNSENADLNKDERIDIVDFIFMKEFILEQV